MKDGGLYHNKYKHKREFLSSLSGVAEVSIDVTYDATSRDVLFPPIRDFYILSKGRELIIQS